MQTIADESYIGERQARKVISQLEQDGVVNVRRFGRRSNHYSLTLPLIKEPKTTDFVGIPTQPNAGLKAGEQAVEPGNTVAEARLTYNLNSINEPARDGAFILFNGLTDTASQSFLSEAGSKTQNPVTSSSELGAPCNGVESAHALLMQKLRSKTPGPSKEDTSRLQSAIEEYGLSEVHQMIEWVFKRKGDFWRKKLKEANFPCSFLCDSMPSIQRQFVDSRSQKSRSAGYRERERAARAEVVTSAPPEVRNAEHSDDIDPDFGTFPIDEDALED